MGSLRLRFRIPLALSGETAIPFLQAVSSGIAPRTLMTARWLVLSLRTPPLRGTAERSQCSQPPNRSYRCFRYVVVCRVFGEVLCIEAEVGGTLYFGGPLGPAVRFVPQRQGPCRSEILANPQPAAV